MKKQLTIAAFISALFTALAGAADLDNAKYFAIDESSIRIEALDDRGGTLPGSGPVINPPIPGSNQLPKPPNGPVINPPADPGAPTGPTVGDTINNIDQIVNLAQKIWDIIKANAPVVNIAVNYANAVPYGTTHWTQLQGWSKPMTKKYAFSMKNGFGSEVVKVLYQVHWVPNGNLQGKGKFLTGVTVEPISVTAAWGYTVDLLAQVPDSTIANVGTHEDPVASMQVQLNWKVSTAFKVIEQKAIYYVQGDGLLQEIGTPFQRDIEIKAQEDLDNVAKKLENVKFD
ncbi:MAG: hypothetical protein HY796_05970 [Elusimicrobia bacterium]|nr:hypothetical protein [Elusimicrobiota bacterium]